MMIHLQSCVFLVVLLCFVFQVPAQQYDGDYICSPWKDGEKVSITFRLDRSKFPSVCDSQGLTGMPFFSMSTDGVTAYGTNCTVQSDIRVPGNCNFLSGTLGCGCTAENDNGYYVIEYNFIAGPDYGRWWQADINCVDINTIPVLSFQQTDCQRIPEVTTTPASTTESTTSVTIVLPTDDGLDGGQIAGIVIGCVAIVIIISITVYILKKKGCFGMPRNATIDSPQPVSDTNNVGTPSAPPANTLHAANGNNGGTAPTNAADKPMKDKGDSNNRVQ